MRSFKLQIYLLVLLLFFPFVGGCQSLFSHNDGEVPPPQGWPVEIYSKVSKKLPAPPITEVKILRQQYSTLKVGMLYYINPPLMNLRWDGRLEGVYADYLSLLQTIAGIPLEVRMYHTMSQAQAALQQGDIQLLASTTSSLLEKKMEESNAIMVQPYTLLTRKENLNMKPAVMNILIAPKIHPDVVSKLQQSYKSVTVAGSAQNAIQDVLNNDSDAYLDGQSQIAYLLAFRPFSDLGYRNNFSLGEQKYNFVDNQQGRLTTLINSIFERIPHALRNEIYERWLSGLTIESNRDAIVFSQKDRDWLKTHPVINVAINSSDAPYAFLDKSNQITGLDIDLLRLLGDKVGVSFNFIAAEGADDVLAMLKEGKAHITPSLIGTPERRKKLLFSDPYGTIEWVMITRNERDAPHNFEQLKHRRIAIPRGHALLDVLKKTPEIYVFEVNNTVQGIDMLLAGAADATLENLASANYLQASRYGSTIAIQSLYNSLQAERLGVALNYPELLEIINKAIVALQPNELRSLRLKWFSVANVTSFDRGQTSPWNMMWTGVLLVITLSSVFWRSYLARQICRRKRAEKKLQNLLGYWETLFNNMPTPMFVCDLSMNIIAANLWFQREMGYVDQTVVGQSLFSLCFLQPADEQEVGTLFLRCLAGAPVHFSDRQIMIHGQSREVYLWFERYSDTEGVVQGIIGGWFDVTERKQLARELLLARNKAERASHEKSDFLARMSHEVRTPLHAIIGILELEVKRQPPQAPVHIAWRAAVSLLGIIGAVLDFSRIEAGQVVLNWQSVALREVLETSAATFEYAAKEKGLAFTTQIDLAPDAYHLLDATRVTQIVNNLLSNAVKFTDHGGITFSVSCVSSRVNQQDEMILQVIDTGCGIPVNMYKAILLPYVQVEHNSMSKGGSGLGLPISAQLSSLMGGELEIKGNQNGGTQAVLRLPLKRSEKPQCDESGDIGCDDLNESLNILLVDDLAANLQVLSLQLTASGHHLTLAESAKQAMGLLENHWFDMVLTDCQMPEMNGYELTGWIREYVKQTQLPPMIVLGHTANAFSTELVRCQEAGMDGVLIKPLTQKKLIAEISRYYRLVHGEPKLTFAEIGALAQQDLKMELRMLKALEQGIVEDIAALDHLPAQTENVLHHAHRIKGAFALLGYQQGIRVCLRIEKGQRNDIETIKKLLQCANYFLVQVISRQEEINCVS
ncbi:hybrid sensor histidine kinase/response regulator [Serratia marcescens]|nr:hybrid sensor histidine kinase/response regulator [Serratia marcescens]